VKMPYRKVGYLEQCWYIIKFKIGSLKLGGLKHGSRIYDSLKHGGRKKITQSIRKHRKHKTRKGE